MWEYSGLGNLTATAVKAAKEPGRYSDGDGLALLIGKRGGKSWIVRVQKDGRRRDIGLGSAKKVSLKLARERAAEVRAQIEVGIDPVAERQKAAGIPSFSEAAKKVHAENAPSWKNPKHAQQWINTLEAYLTCVVTVFTHVNTIHANTTLIGGDKIESLLTFEAYITLR